MKQVTIYHYSKCSTCRDAVKVLKAAGYALNSIEIFDEPPSADMLAVLVKKSGLPLQKFFNTSGEAYKEMGLKDKVKAMSDEEKIRLLSSNGRLIKRPIVTDGKQVTVGFKEEPFKQIWS